MKIVETCHGDVGGLPVRWLRAACEDPPILWVHGVPDSADLWRPFLGRAGGIAVDLPGFGGSGKPAEWPYSASGYARFLHAFLDHLGLERVRVAAHDWGGVALALGARIERLAAIDVVPLLPEHSWHVVARAWRTPVIGELAMGFTGRLALRRVGGLESSHADAVLRHFDHGTQRAILKLYRSTRADPPAALAPRLGEITGPALVLWGGRDRYLEPAWAERIAAALGGEAAVHVTPEAGHWPWQRDPALVANIIGALT